MTTLRSLPLKSTSSRWWWRQWQAISVPWRIQLDAVHMVCRWRHCQRLNWCNWKMPVVAMITNRFVCHCSGIYKGRKRKRKEEGKREINQHIFFCTRIFSLRHGCVRLWHWLSEYGRMRFNSMNCSVSQIRWMEIFMMIIVVNIINIIIAEDSIHHTQPSHPIPIPTQGTVYCCLHLHINFYFKWKFIYVLMQSRQYLRTKASTECPILQSKHVRMIKSIRVLRSNTQSVRPIKIWNTPRAPSSTSCSAYATEEYS